MDSFGRVTLVGSRAFTIQSLVQDCPISGSLALPIARRIRTVLSEGGDS